MRCAVMPLDLVKGLAYCKKVAVSHRKSGACSAESENTNRLTGYSETDKDASSRESGAEMNRGFDDSEAAIVSIGSRQRKTVPSINI